MLHIWHEDSYNPTTGQKSSTQLFWEFLKAENVSPKLIGADICGFNGNITFYNYLLTTPFNNTDKYIILFDFVLDNYKALRMYRKLKSLLSRFPNVYLADLLCFEYLMLCFQHLDVWTKPIGTRAIPIYSNLLDLRKEFIKCKTTGVTWKGNKNLNAYATTNRLTSEEEIATHLLQDITSVNHKFIISKTSMGNCWFINCCINPYMGKNSCNIFRYKKSSNIKARNLYNETIAKTLIMNYG